MEFHSDQFIRYVDEMIGDTNYPVSEYNPECEDLENTTDMTYPNESWQSQERNDKIPGRAKNPFTIVLEKFYSSRVKHPKKEFFNAFIIRAIKRAFRSVISGKIPKTTCIIVDYTKESEAKLWNEIERLYRRNPALIKKISQTENGPLTDGKAKRESSEEVEQKFKSFNNEFCKRFFESELTREAFLVLIELIFSNFDPQTLCYKFKFKCCLSTSHTVECENNWYSLKQYFREKYFKDMEIEFAGHLTFMAPAFETLEDLEVSDRFNIYMVSE